MKRSIVAVLALAVGFTWARGADEKFSSVVSPEDFAAAGLSGLTPAQLARLNTLIENYKSGALAVARRATDDALAAKQLAEAQAARSEAKAEAARSEAKAEAARADAAKAEAARVQASKADSTPGILTKAKDLLTPAKRPEVVAIESSISGKFRGWQPRQIFVLENGQRLQVANNDSYYSPVIENPKVQVVPAAFSGYWLRFPELDQQVRVNLLEGK